MNAADTNQTIKIPRIPLSHPTRFQNQNNQNPGKIPVNRKHWNERERRRDETIQTNNNCSIKAQLHTPRGAYTGYRVHGSSKYTSSFQSVHRSGSHRNACRGLSTCSTAGIRPKVGGTAGSGGPPRPRSRLLRSRAGSVCVCVPDRGRELKGVEEGGALSEPYRGARRPPRAVVARR